MIFYEPSIIRDCSGQGCKRRFHLSCVDPPLSYLPPGVWHCAWCTDRKIKFGLHSVSEGLESIWDVREVLSNNQGNGDVYVLQISVIFFTFSLLFFLLGYSNAGGHSAMCSQICRGRKNIW